MKQKIICIITLIIVILHSSTLVAQSFSMKTQMENGTPVGMFVFPPQNPGIYKFDGSIGVGKIPQSTLDVQGNINGCSLQAENCQSAEFGVANLSPSGHIFKVPLTDGVQGNLCFSLVGGQYLKMSFVNGVVTGINIDFTPPTDEEKEATKIASEKYKENNASKTELSPNPFGEIVSVVPPAGCTKIVIYNTAGKIIYDNYRNGSCDEKINTFSWKTGQYLFLFLNSEGKKISEKMGIKE